MRHKGHIMYARNARKDTGGGISGTDIALYTFATASVLCSSIVMLLCAWESHNELQRIKDEYSRVTEQIQVVKVKQANDEALIEALVDNVIQLRKIGIV